MNGSGGREQDRHTATTAGEDVRRARRPRLAIFTSHPIQYQAPLFRHLAARDDIEVVVFFGSRQGLDVTFDRGFGTTFQWDIPLLDGYEHAFLPNEAAPGRDVGSFGGIRLRRPETVLREGRFDVCLVLGWQTMGHAQMMRAAWRTRVPLLLRGESTLQRRPPGGVFALLRRLLWLPAREHIYAAIFRRVTAFAVIGSRNADFYRHFGVPDSKLVWAPYGVANEHFALAPAPRAASRERLRQQLQCGPRTTVFASVAKLVPFKRPFDLLSAFAALVADGIDARLVYVGDGPERAAVEEAIERRELGAHVTISGFVNQSALPDWYAAIDCLVLPSDYLETWGLVVNEAMAAELPVVVSDAAGCAPDLVREGVNGFTFPLGDIAQLSQRMRIVASAGTDGRLELGSRSREIVADFTLAAAAEAIARRVLSIAGTPG